MVGHRLEDTGHRSPFPPAILINLATVLLGSTLGLGVTISKLQLFK